MTHVLKGIVIEAGVEKHFQAGDGMARHVCGLLNQATRLSTWPSPVRDVLRLAGASAGDGGVEDATRALVQFCAFGDRARLRRTIQHALRERITAANGDARAALAGFTPLRSKLHEYEPELGLDSVFASV